MRINTITAMYVNELGMQVVEFLNQLGERMIASLWHIAVQGNPGRWYGELSYQESEGEKGDCPLYLFHGSRRRTSHTLVRLLANRNIHWDSNVLAQEAA